MYSSRTVPLPHEFSNFHPVLGIGDGAITITNASTFSWVFDEKSETFEVLPATPLIQFNILSKQHLRRKPTLVLITYVPHREQSFLDLNENYYAFLHCNLELYVVPKKATQNDDPIVPVMTFFHLINGVGSMLVLRDNQVVIRDSHGKNIYLYKIIFEGTNIYCQLMRHIVCLQNVLHMANLDDKTILFCHERVEREDLLGKSYLNPFVAFDIDNPANSHLITFTDIGFIEQIGVTSTGLIIVAFPAALGKYICVLDRQRKFFYELNESCHSNFVIVPNRDAVAFSRLNTARFSPLDLLPSCCPPYLIKGIDLIIRGYLGDLHSEVRTASRLVLASELKKSYTDLIKERTLLKCNYFQERMFDVAIQPFLEINPLCDEISRVSSKMILVHEPYEPFEQHKILQKVNMSEHKTAYLFGRYVNEGLRETHKGHMIGINSFDDKVCIMKLNVNPYVDRLLDMKKDGLLLCHTTVKYESIKSLIFNIFHLNSENHHPTFSLDMWNYGDCVMMTRRKDEVVIFVAEDYCALRQQPISREDYKRNLRLWAHDFYKYAIVAMNIKAGLYYVITEWSLSSHFELDENDKSICYRGFDDSLQEVSRKVSVPDPRDIENIFSIPVFQVLLNNMIQLIKDYMGFAMLKKINVWQKQEFITVEKNTQQKTQCAIL